MNIFYCLLSSSFVSLTYSPCFTHKSTIFLHHLFFKLQEKVWVFLFSLSISCFLPRFGFLSCCWVLAYMMIRLWDRFIFVSLNEWVLMALRIWCLIYMFSCMCLIFEWYVVIVPCWVDHAPSRLSQWQLLTILCAHSSLLHTTHTCCSCLNTCLNVAYLVHIPYLSDMSF